MKYITYTMLLFSVCVFAEWDNVDQSTLSNINTNVSNINGNIANYMSFIDTYFKPNWKIEREQIRLNGDWLEALYEGYDPSRVTGETVNNDLQPYRNIFNTIHNKPEAMTDETDEFNAFIHSYSSVNYQYSISNLNPTANNFMNYGQYFNYSDKMKIKLNNDGINETDSWFDVDVYNNSVYSVKHLKHEVETNLNTMVEEVPENLPGQIADPNILFSINLSSIFDLFVRLNLWQANPVQNLIVHIKLVPTDEHDYLYSFYTWWNSNNFYPMMFHKCLKALIYLVTFIYCYNYVVSTWNA